MFTKWQNAVPRLHPMMQTQKYILGYHAVSNCKVNTPRWKTHCLVWNSSLTANGWQPWQKITVWDDDWTPSMQLLPERPKVSTGMTEQILLNYGKLLQSWFLVWVLTGKENLEIWVGHALLLQLDADHNSVTQVSHKGGLFKPCIQYLKGVRCQGFSPFT